MKAKFELQTWMSENREVVISKYNALAEEKFFNGISLKNFMIRAISNMEMNNPKSEKRAQSLLPLILSNLYINNSNIGTINDLDAKLAEKYKGTAYMALV